MDTTIKSSSSRNTTIDYLKAFAIILVVLGHSLSFYANNINPLPNGMKIFSSLVYAVHVPLFFLIAGYLCHKQDVKKFYQKKFLRILIPFITFTVLKLLFSNLVTKDFIHGNSVWEQLLDAFVFGELYWFAYSIFLMFLMMPLIWEKNYKEPPRKAILFLLLFIIFNTLLGAFNNQINFNFFQIQKTIYYLPFFLSGFIARYYKDLISHLIHKYKVIIAAICLFLIVMYSVLIGFGVGINSYLVKYMIAIALMYCLYLIASLVKKGNKTLSRIGQFSFQLMLLDSFYKVILYNNCTVI